MSGYIKTHVSREEDNVDRGATIADILAARSSLGIRAANDPSVLTITEKVIIIWDRRLYDTMLTNPPVPHNRTLLCFTDIEFT